jgi:hypothetical protein
MAFLRRFGAQKYLRLSAGPLRPAALLLSAVEDHDHPEMFLCQGDGVHGRVRNTGSIQQLFDHMVDGGDHVVARQVVHHQPSVPGPRAG